MALGAAGAVVTGGNPAGGGSHAPSGRSVLAGAGGPPSAGKTAPLPALLSLPPPETVAYFTRGAGETFSLPPRSDDHPTYLLVNEMSDHLPVYTWGSYARRAFWLMV